MTAKGRKRPWSLGVLLGLLAMALCPSPAQAHGGGTPQVVAAPVGPYALSVWTQPDPPQVGTLHLTAVVFLPGTTRDVAVLDAQVRARLTSTEGVSLEVPLTHAQAVNPMYYEADVRLPQPGKWTVTLSVQGPDGAGETAFVLDVRPARPWRWWGGALLAVVGLLALRWFGRDS